MTQVVRTVLGDIAPGELGRTDYHEHLFQRTPLLPGDDLDDPQLSGREAAALGATGFDAIVDLTPIGLGRRPRDLAEISRRTDLHVVAATGVHHRGHYPDGHAVHGWGAEELAERFVAELTTAIGPEPGDLPATQGSVASGVTTAVRVRAGVIKVGTGYWEISAFEERTLTAAAAAHGRTGAAVVCHLELGTAAWEVADLLERHGVPRERIVLAHADRNPDPGLHSELAASGTYLGYDGAARTRYWPDSVLIACLLEVAAGGGRERLLLGGDVARRSSFTAYGGMPGMAYLGERFVPRLREAGGDALLADLLVANPARAFVLDV